MFELLHPGRPLELDSPLGVEELTRRLERTFDGTLAGGRVRIMRRVRGRNSFRSLVDGRIVPAPAGSRLSVRLRLHPLILAIGAAFAVVAGTLAAIAAPGIPVVGSSPFLVRLLAMAGVMSVFALLASLEARTSARLLSDAASATPTGPSHRNDPS